MGVVYKIVYDERVVNDDLPTVDKTWRREIERAVATKLTSNPALYGKPLHAPLSGFHKIRVGDYRVIFTITKQTVTVFLIFHRKGAYPRAEKRLLRYL